MKLTSINTDSVFAESVILRWDLVLQTQRDMLGVVVFIMAGPGFNMSSHHM